jgi:hypothetical protein
LRRAGFAAQRIKLSSNKSLGHGCRKCLRIGCQHRATHFEVKGDSKKEANETFYLDLFDLSSNTLFTKNRGIARS